MKTIRTSITKCGSPDPGPPRRVALLRTAVVLVSLSAVNCMAQDAARDWAERINQANAALRAGDVSEALQGYQQATELNADSDELNFNRAVALYRQGDLEAAQQLFERVSKSTDDTIAARARFNSGNSRFAAAVQLKDQEPAKAIPQLEAAIRDYRSSLSIQPDTDARANIELAAKLIDELQRRQQQQQQQDQRDSSQQPDSQQSKSQDEPSSQQSESELQQQQRQQNQDEQANQNEQASEEKGQNEQAQQDQPAKQQQDQRTDSQSGERTPPNDPPSESQAEGQQRQTGGTQQPIDQPSDQTTAGQLGEQHPSPQQSSATDRTRAEPSAEAPDTPEDQRTEQPASPEGELTAANSMSEVSGDQQQMAAANDAMNNGPLTRDEAIKLLQAIRDRDMLRRLRRQAAERARHIPVEKDW